MLTVHLHFLINVCLLKKYPWSNLTELNAAKPNCSRSWLNLSDYLKGGSSWALSLCLLVVILCGVLGFVTRTILHNYESKRLDVLSTKFSFTLKSDAGDLQESTKYRRVCNKNSRNWKQFAGTLSMIIYNSFQTLSTLGIGTDFCEWCTQFEPVPRAGSTIPWRTTEIPHMGQVSVGHCLILLFCLYLRRFKVTLSLKNRQQPHSSWSGVNRNAVVLEAVKPAHVSWGLALLCWGAH